MLITIAITMSVTKMTAPILIALAKKKKKFSQQPQGKSKSSEVTRSTS